MNGPNKLEHSIAKEKKAWQFKTLQVIGPICIFCVVNTLQAEH